MRVIHELYIEERTTVVISVYNEEESIGNLLNNLLSRYPNIYIIIINDGSEDATKNILEIFSHYKKITIIENQVNKWLNYSIKRGIRNIKTDFFIVMDGDFQHPVENIRDFLNIFHNNSSIDLVIAERKNIHLCTFWYRSLISKFGILLCNIKLRNFSIRDPLSWFFWWKLSTVNNLLDHTNSKDKWYKILFDILNYHSWEPYIIESFSYIFQNRKTWSSKISIRVYIIFLFSLLK